MFRRRSAVAGLVQSRGGMGIASYFAAGLLGVGVVMVTVRPALKEAAEKEIAQAKAQQDAK